MAVRIKDTKKDQPGSASDTGYYGKDREDLLPQARVGGQATIVSKPSLGDHGEIEENDGDRAACNEEGLVFVGASIYANRSVSMGMRGQGPMGRRSRHNFGEESRT